LTLLEFAGHRSGRALAVPVALHLIGEPTDRREVAELRRGI
jgi:hypothetical protein